MLKSYWIDSLSLHSQTEPKRYQANQEMSKTPELAPGLDVVQTGSLKLDYVLFTGGIPKGTICEISGTTGSGKTSLCLQILTSAQAHGEQCIFIDADHMLDILYAQKIGVELSNLVVIEPMHIAETLDIIHTLCHSGVPLIIVVDSITDALWDPDNSTANFEEKLLIDHRISNYLQNLTPIIRGKGIILIFTHLDNSQHGKVYYRLRDNTDRLALQLHAGLRIQLDYSQHIKQNDEIIGQRSNIRILKNKYSPFKDQTELDIIYGVGIHKTGEIIDLGDRLQIVKRQESHYVFQNNIFGPGRENAIRFLDKNPSIRSKIEQAIRHRIAVPKNS